MIRTVDLFPEIVTVSVKGIVAAALFLKKAEE